MLRVYGQSLTDALLPSTCQLCGMVTRGALRCAPCSSQLPWNHCACPGCASPVPLAGVRCAQCLAWPMAFDGAFAAFTLRAPVQESIHALKYRARFASAVMLGEAFAEAYRATRQPLPGCLVPVPLHWRRQWWRGYNQAIELARVIGHTLAIPVVPEAARRPRATPDQIGQNASARRRNLAGAFAASPQLAGQHIALLDDVMTTGATLDALARACKAAGASRVEAWAIARQPLPD